MSAVSNGHQHFKQGFFLNFGILKNLQKTLILTSIVTNQPPYALFFLVRTSSIDPSYIVRGFAFY